MYTRASYPCRNIGTRRHSGTTCFLSREVHSSTSSGYLFIVLSCRFRSDNSPLPWGEGCELRFLPFLKDNELIGRCTSLEADEKRAPVMPIPHAHCAPEFRAPGQERHLLFLVENQESRSLASLRRNSSSRPVIPRSMATRSLVCE